MVANKEIKHSYWESAHHFITLDKPPLIHLHQPNAQLLLLWGHPPAAWKIDIANLLHIVATRPPFIRLRILSSHPHIWYEHSQHSHHYASCSIYNCRFMTFSQDSHQSYVSDLIPWLRCSVPSPEDVNT